MSAFAAMRGEIGLPVFVSLRSTPDAEPPVRTIVFQGSADPQSVQQRRQDLESAGRQLGPAN